MRQLSLSISRHWRVRRLHSRLVTVASLHLADWGVLGEALIALVVVKVALHTTDFRRLMAWASRIDRPVEDEPSRQQVERIAWLVDKASRLAWLRCLPRSLALTRVLARRGIASTLRIGVRTERDELLAHAWVEWRGRALHDDERSLQRFAPFDGPLRGASNA